MKALIIGATGATGKDLVTVLLQRTAYTEIVLFVRRPTGLINAKLTEVITDFEKLEAISDFIRGDVWFSCIGTTLKTAGTKQKQWHIDFEMPAKFAEIARRNHIPSAVLLSAYGASANSRIFYSKMKGQLENHIAGLAFDRYIVFKPGMLLRKNTDRAGERITGAILKLLNGAGLFRKFRPLPTSVLAEKMADAPALLGPGAHEITLEKIWDL